MKQYHSTAKSHETFLVIRVISTHHWLIINRTITG
jgi:hypothetical protein